jgi:hypothetical protein
VPTLECDKACSKLHGQTHEPVIASSETDDWKDVLEAASLQAGFDSEHVPHRICLAFFNLVIVLLDPKYHQVRDFVFFFVRSFD